MIWPRSPTSTSTWLDITSMLRPSSTAASARTTSCGWARYSQWLQALPSGRATSATSTGRSGGISTIERTSSEAPRIAAESRPRSSPRKPSARLRASAAVAGSTGRAPSRHSSRRLR
jgi:hypothetical protein